MHGKFVLLQKKVLEVWVGDNLISLLNFAVINLSVKID